MKNLFRPIFVLLLTLACACEAQQDYRTFNVVGLSLGYTNFGTNIIVPASQLLSTNTMARYVTNNSFLAEGNTVDCYVSLQLRGSGTTAIPITLQKSYDNRVWSTLTTFTITPSGTTLVSTATNGLTMNNYGYVRASEVNNVGNSSGVTNLTIRFSSKAN
jgi:hypothetical protein